MTGGCRGALPFSPRAARRPRSGVPASALDRLDAQHLPVLGHRAPRDGQTLLRELARDLGVRQRVVGALGLDDVLDQAADRGGRAGRCRWR
ncbi:MAG: hypothetical protein MZW92_69635 [Comamonadaceae bacterium]|nr:hypothetical protein [Comamonadaceae bacterium]